MIATVKTVAFEGIDARPVEVQVQISSGLPAFTIVGLPDKAVTEARERVRSALSALGLGLPAERITVNLSPASMPKNGSHLDLSIALAILTAMQVLPADTLSNYYVMGELGLDGSVRAVNGVLPAAVFANSEACGLVCPYECGGEAAWAGNSDILAPKSLLALINHFKGSQVLSTPSISKACAPASYADFRDIKGQEGAKRILEIAAAGGHNVLMSGPPGSGKSMLASRFPSILPPMSAMEALETSMIASVAGLLENGVVSKERPFRDPHHSASLPALIGGGARALPGEVSLANGGVLFLDELPEFARTTLEALRQPLESGKAVIARAQAHISYPARFQLVAAMNPCKCGYLSDEGLACNRAPKCAVDYQSKISGPLYDRMDLHVEVAAVSPTELTSLPNGESSNEIAARVQKARDIQQDRFERLAADSGILVNAHADGELLTTIASPDEKGKALLERAVGQMHLSARGYHRVLRVARTLADLAGEEAIMVHHIAEALSYRRPSLMTAYQKTA
ncbi:YifB family Mg chelatase-like AAA ATPase [Kordiimonas sp. SCSIO 12610]|uniref:YifB family Mg chelatase-like AAA ATPase n=1 Tax=Kordiimonas sp. SCSIO 12610 TaxID=2829597 RepID=UPI00210BB411|nr:YifB family Mg chelatase-like AAA ATPase [Kordiimonas sp. SCSIO 12610]UTW55438.1 YifB family Mg chelatase-like AAA ATPase [Kordiimonas sp. SCSIO 12610]